MSRSPSVAAVTCALVLVGPACGGGGPTTPSPIDQTPRVAVRGAVRDAGNGNLLAHVTVELIAGSDRSVTETPFEGTFSFTVARGVVSVTASADGYATQSRTIDIAADTSLDLSLERVAGRRVACGDAPDTGNRVLSLLSRPFEGSFPLSNYFDHDLPLEFEDANGYQTTACDERVSAGGHVDGHNGYDWLLPSGTRVVAAAEGQVIFAGTDSPFSCPPLGRIVSDQLAVEIRHPAVNGEEFSTTYVHLSRLDLSVGQTVVRGQTMGQSGNTGCSTTPHLHFHVWRFTHTNTGRPTRVDPYGWEGRGRDPWADHPSGAGSIWLWRPGEAPALR